jgi:hypothetical protein
VGSVEHYCRKRQGPGCFVLPPLREAVAHFARRNARSTDTEMGSSDDGDTHTCIDIAANFGVGILPLLGKHGGPFPQQDLGFFTEETIHRYHKRRKVSTLLKASPEVFLLLLAFMSCQHFGRVFKPIAY